MVGNLKLGIVWPLVAAAIITIAASIAQDSAEGSLTWQMERLFEPTLAIGSFALGAFLSFLFQWGIDSAQFDKILKLLPLKHMRVMEVLCKTRTATLEYLCYASRLPKTTVCAAISYLQSKNIIRLSDGNDGNDGNDGTYGNDAKVVESRIYFLHQASEAMKSLPGLSEGRLVVALLAVLLFGMSFSVIDGYYAQAVRHHLRPTAYILSLEFIALGGASSLLARRFIARVHFRRIIGILPKDEQTVLSIIYQARTITQYELVQKTGMYKMKVSRILGKFQQRGLIERMPYGYTNLVVLKI